MYIAERNRAISLSNVRKAHELTLQQSNVEKGNAETMSPPAQTHTSSQQHGQEVKRDVSQTAHPASKKDGKETLVVITSLSLKDAA